MAQLVIYADGLCEPFNPGGWACWGWVALEDGQEIASGHGCAGHGRGVSNNLAEYKAAVEAMRWAVAQRRKGVLLRTDSQLVVRQAAGDWDCHAQHLLPFVEELRYLLRQAQGRIEWVPRERNQRADALSREAYEEAVDRARVARAADVQIEKKDGKIIANGRYLVDLAQGTCTCPDFQHRHQPCKHLIAARLHVEGRG